MGDIIQAFFICLLASMIWAPIVFLIASRFTKKEGNGIADKLWPSALVIAALPALFAPFAAAFGLSLRNPAPLPPMGALAPLTEYVPVVTATPVVAPTPTLDIAATLEATAVLYFYGFLMFLALGVVRMVWFSYRVRYAFDIDEPALEEGLEAWRLRMGIKMRPRYAFTDAVSSVCVHGFIRPVILMPMSLLDRVSLDDAILMGAHEMAHIKRGDTFLFALCGAVKAVFWFNPFMQRIAARANLAAEQAADALVIARGAERRQYAHCFVQGLRFAAGASHPGRELVPSFTPFDKRSRRERLDAILSKTVPSPILSLPSKVGLVLSILAAAGFAFAQAALAVAPKPAKEALPTAPVEGKVTQKFGAKNKIFSEEPRTHKGVDIKAARGTVVRAAGDGKVIAATSRYRGQPAWGKVVVIDHGHGLVTRYAHLDSYVVKRGDNVDAGDLIGAVGSTGKTTGPHLHFEVMQDGLAIDPAPVLAPEPMEAPAFAPSPAPKPAKKYARAIKIAPAPVIVAEAEAAAEPKVAPEPPVEPLSLAERIEKELAGRFDNFDVRVAETFEGFEMDFEDLEDFEFEGFDFSDFNFEGFDTFVMNTFEDVRGIEELSEEERKEFVKAHKEAMKEARKAAQVAQKDMERAMRDHERARARAERDRERAERDRERAERERERQMERAQARAEREMERAERDRERIEHEHYEVDEAEMLAHREEALREAQADLEEALADIKRQREELEREKRDAKDK